MERILSGVYIATTMLLFVRMVLGSWGLRRILRESKAIPDLGPDILESDSLVVPGSVGFFRARILLPRARREWDEVKLRTVLAHERAHIRRRDWVIRVASHVNVCVFWFHPLAWWLERELARLAEEASDDLALSEIADREAYAAILVDIALTSVAHRGILNWRIVSMAKESNVILRVNRILNTTLPVPQPVGRLAWVALLACSIPGIYLSAAVELVSGNRASTGLEQVTVVERSAEEMRPAPFPVRKSPMRLIAQAAPNRPVRPAPPPTTSRREDPPISICILIDNSGSVRDKRDAVKTAALALVRASRSRDEVCIVNFNDEVFTSLPHGKDFTSDIGEMEEALAQSDSRGGTAMRDAIRMSLDHVEQRAHHDKRALVLVTEGNDTSSTITQAQLLTKVKKSGLPAYFIGLPDEGDPGQASVARLALRQLAETSGGLVYYPRYVVDFESAALEIANEVRKR